MAFPASRLTATSNWTALAAGAFESVVDQGAVQDYILKECPMFYIIDQMGMMREGAYSHSSIVRVSETDDSQPKSFTGLDTLSKGTVQAPRAMVYPFYNYDINVTIPWEDEITLTGADALGDYVEETTFKQARALGARMSDDMVHGNQSDAKNFLGLEQMVITAADTGSVTLTGNRWNYRQMTNTIGGVARTAWTSETAGGTGAENVSVDMAGITDTPAIFSLTTNQNGSQSIQLLNHIINVCTYEATTPDLILSSWKPQEDMNNAGFGLQRLKQDEKGSVDLGLSVSSYKGLKWFASPRFAHSLLAPTGGTTPALSDIVYVLTSKTWEYRVHKEANWATIPFLGLTDQAGAIGRIRNRAQLICKNFALNASMYNYGDTD